MPKVTRGQMPQQMIEGARSPLAGAGRGVVNPRPVNVSEEDYVSPTDRAAMETQREEDRMMRASEREYNKLMPKKMAQGGSASSRADGIAERGHTKGKIC